MVSGHTPQAVGVAFDSGRGVGRLIPRCRPFAMAPAGGWSHLTQKEKEEVIDSIDWVFWDVKKSISSCNRLLCLATDTSMELDQRDKDVNPHKPQAVGVCP